MQKFPRNDDNNLICKILLIGGAGVGKYKVLDRFVDGSYSDFYKATIGTEFKTKDIVVNDKPVKLQVWTTAGQERFQSLSFAFYRGADAVLIFCDLTKRESFVSLQSFIDGVHQHSDPGVKIFIVGTKSDIPEDQRAVSKKELQQFAQDRGYECHLTSAKTGDGVEALFTAVATQCLGADDTSWLSNAWERIKNGAKAFRESFHIGAIFNAIYPFDGLDMVNSTINGGNDVNPKLYTEYAQSYFTRITSFLGLPNRLLPGYGTEEGAKFGKLGNLWRNFFGWQPQRTWGKLLFNAIFVGGLNVIATPLKFALNVVKLATEFLPLVVGSNLWRFGTTVGNWSIKKFKHLFSPVEYEGEFDDETSSGLLHRLGQGFRFIGYGVALIFAIPFILSGIAVILAYHFIGRAITSPIKNVREMWLIGEFIGKKNQSRILGHIISLSLSLITIASTVVIYAIGFPLLIKAIPTTVMPFLAEHLPAVLSSGISYGVNVVFPLFANSVFQGISAALSSIGLTISPAGIGFGAYVGLFMTTVGVGINHYVEKFRNHWADVPTKSTWFVDKQTLENEGGHGSETERSATPGGTHTHVAERLLNNGASVTTGADSVDKRARTKVSFPTKQSEGTASGSPSFLSAPTSTRLEVGEGEAANAGQSSNRSAFCCIL